MTTVDAQLDRIRTKLKEVRRRRVDTFGAGSHGYELGPPIAEERVRAFEVEHGITLPDGYRAFITTIGYGGPGPYGGAGPYYGLYDLDSWDEFAAWVADEAPSDWLRRPSPLRPGANDLPETDPDGTPDEDWPSEELLSMYGGILTIGNRGCTYLTGLVVTGESRGRIVYLDGDQYEPPYVGRDADFLDWYERWLDELLAGVESTWFGYGPAGDEAALLQIIGSSADGELVAEAIANLHKLPTLSDAVWPAVRAVIGHDAPGVRVTAARLLEKSSAPEDIEAVSSLVDDPDATVRGAVFRALIAMAPEHWREHVLQALFTDEDVRVNAFHALADASLLTNAQLVEIASRKDMPSLIFQAVHRIKFEPQHLELLSELLVHENPTIRQQAALALAKLELSPADDRVVQQLNREEHYAPKVALIRLVAAIEERRAVPRLLEIAAEGHDFQRLDAFNALCELGDERAVPIAEELLTIDRTPVAPGRSHTRTIAALARDALEASPSPTLRALGKVV